MELQELIHIDKQHIWHPYASATDPAPCFPVKKAAGVYLELENGKKLIDGMSSWWSAIHGYNHPQLNQAMMDQAKDMSHIMFGGLTHKPAVELTMLLLSIVPKGLERVFYCDSGSVAVEVAMKMALQYWHTSHPAKKKFVTIRGGYHGDTWHAMSVCDPVTGMHNIFKGVLNEQYFLSQPSIKFGEAWKDTDIKEARIFFEKNHSGIAAFILEPIVQGAGGMYFYHAAYLKQIRKLCDDFNILLIADEIATGFGRTGKMFACNHAGITPDIMCLGKAITGGYLSFAATLCNENVAVKISKDEPGVFMHGPTFMGNPLACSLALKSIELLLSSNWEATIQKMENQLKYELSSLAKNKHVSEVRCMGAIGVVEMKEPVNISEIQELFVQNGIWLRPFGKLIYMMPPYIITTEELSKLTGSLLKVFKNYYGE